jgi:hypothetical protein
MTMTESEKFIFKTLQWLIALGVTLLLFGFGYFISFLVSMNSKQNYQGDQIKYLIHYVYTDSIHNVRCEVRVKELERKVESTFYVKPKIEAVLPKQELTHTEPNLDK